MSDLVDHPLLLATIAIGSYPMYRALIQTFFSDKAEFIEATKYTVTPDIFSLIRGRLRQDWDATLKWNVCAFLCIGWVAALYEICIRLFF